MKAMLFGAVLGILLLWPATLSLTADTATVLAAQPAVLAFTLGFLARPAIVRRVRTWAR